MLALLLVLAGASLAAAKSNCDPKYECKYHYETATHLWLFDFTDSCKEGSEFVYNTNRGDHMKYLFQICGTTTYDCATTELLSSGSVVQVWDAATKGLECEVLGSGYPIYQPWDAPNPNSPPNGINITFNGVPPDVYDPNPCPANKDTDTDAGRSSVLRLTCDPTVDGVAVQGVEESPTCFYNIYGRSRFACASRYRGPDASGADTGDPNQFIGLTGGESFGCIIAGVAIAIAVWMGVTYARTRALPTCGNRGGSASASLAASGGAPAFGGSTSVGKGSGYGQVA
ncbi:hypothetical protein FNF27_06444 [Cafeteria roenbergensis]|uniref:MRH domain-containing protein n=2 Tax=Cafeteria roenbergensis TaxID=33653 RepID=A0A5A8E2B0_CAFRO|nr:hypothetical protein FNF29_03598 [Cafeteria roenbergensis]KAA0159590.1 hypothetical protein FNF28_05794 [Cafeteria roenbergensis]KAA0165808.1 hypothetical protein FNF31_01785 [Cafeteria roenbergensis]KAA0170967.1 hypothetical protein FNF27_06444 [Cafeteria roenbergensis]|eukprot:KAA0152709.1 hypothetical protein FNF29_03598 [Cafeteria roenbergensis]